MDPPRLLTVNSVFGKFLRGRAEEYDTGLHCTAFSVGNISGRRGETKRKKNHRITTFTVVRFKSLRTSGNINNTARRLNGCSRRRYPKIYSPYRNPAATSRAINNSSCALFISVKRYRFRRKYL